ncbi:MAG: hypothetical protein WC330_01015 [Candidatus Omnitrophota bacterium]|jgi:hypothetical protein
MKINILLSIFVFSLLFGYDIGFCQESVTITTYYPAPFGVYVTLRTLNGNNEVILNNDGGNPNIELRRVNVAGGVPYIDFTNDPATDYDFRLILADNNTFQIRGGAANSQVQILDASGNPTHIRVKDVIVCP